MKVFLKHEIEKFRSGFSLIELMVVIAIIGILSAVVLTNLNSARGSSANAAIKANLNNIRGQALIFYDTKHPVYGTIFNYAPAGSGVCNKNGSVFTDPKIQEQMVAINSITGSSALTYCRVNTSNWFIVTKLNVQEGNFTRWCVDETGVSRGITETQYNNNIILNPSQYSCP